MEALSKKLFHPRVEIRLRSASSILFKLECGIFNQRDIRHDILRCSLLDGVNKSISILLHSTTDHIVDSTSEYYQLVLLLLSIVRFVYQSTPLNLASMDISTMILGHLYKMKSISDIDNKLGKSLDEVHYLLL